MIDFDPAPDRLDDELRLLLRRHPRDGWAERADLGETARFWLDRHAFFRRLDTLVRDGLFAAGDRKVDPEQSAPWLGRHLNRFLGELEGHHQVEDAHYFPLFARSEPRLQHGFDLLDSDHEQIHAALGTIAEQANLLLARDPLAAAFTSNVRAFADLHARLGRGLLRHLEDEEDIVIPLLIEGAGRYG